MEKKDLYIAELLFNLGRFVEQPKSVNREETLEAVNNDCHIWQHIQGDYNALTGIYGSEDALCRFAEIYSKMDLSLEPGLAPELIADFLNLHNGLFTVNLSESENIESTLAVPVFNGTENLPKPLGSVHVIPVEFSFGKLSFFLCEG